MMRCKRRYVKPACSMVESHAHQPWGCIMHYIYVILHKIGHKVPSIDRQQLNSFVDPCRNGRNMHNPDSFFNDVRGESFFLRHKKPHGMTLAYKIVGKIYCRCYNAIGFWIEDVEPEGNPHRNNPLNSASGMLTEQQYSFNHILRMKRIWYYCFHEETSAPSSADAYSIYPVRWISGDVPARSSGL